MIRASTWVTRGVVLTSIDARMRGEGGEDNMVS
ncbi:hypothetical protein PPSIR1_14990 [Plesiocystis pacifica SIR-1]|uniref:Uncharacterized protein n=1 Tax=Plesiocystis pacifica SIR-1 TaxID=391625 RepID=A6G6C5_9BACT|nr:hypothetical protein PPSIR1_14990 [Plesiocystis pacifica SIR-1]